MRFFCNNPANKLVAVLASFRGRGEFIDLPLCLGNGFRVFQ
jgi:hypothetical protein